MVDADLKSDKVSRNCQGRHPGMSMSFWENQRVLVTGGAGFLGSQVCRKLRGAGAAAVFAPRSREYDLREKEAVVRVLRDTSPTLVIHLAAVVGGIGANRKNPGKFYYDNAIMGIQLMEQARQAQVEKFVAIGTVCAYPKFSRVPFREDALWDGYPEETNAPYGIAKKILAVQSQAYREQYGFNSVFLLPVNLYGPGDNFDPESSHVIPALIRKCVEARRKDSTSIECWGTGSATREFLYVEDAAEAIVLAAETLQQERPGEYRSRIRNIHQGTGRVHRALDRIQGRIEWNPAYPDGQPRRALDTSRALREFGFRAQVDVRTGPERHHRLVPGTSGRKPRQPMTGRSRSPNPTERPLQIAFDARSLCGARTGVGTYTANLLHELLRIDSTLRILLVADQAVPASTGLDPKRVRGTHERLPRAQQFLLEQLCVDSRAPRAASRSFSILPATPCRYGPRARPW